MRDFFIQSFENLVSVIVVLMMIGSVLGAFIAGAQEGFLTFVLVLIMGALYTVLLGGGLYLGLGIYQNTKRSAELLERIASKQG